MTLIPWSSKESTRIRASEIESSSSTLDGEEPQYNEWSTRCFEISDLLSQRVPGEDNLFILNFRLERIDFANSGNTQNPVPPSSFLSLKAEGKEMALLTGLLMRQCTIKEPLQNHRASHGPVIEELRALREEVEELNHENRVLKHTLGELQRPRRVS